MKKLTITLSIILIVVYASLAILGRGGEYAAEKLFHGAMKKAHEIVTNPDVAPPAQIASVEKQLKLLIKKYPGANITKFGHIGLLEFYTVTKKYDEALNEVEDMKRVYASDPGTLSTAQFAKGIVYERQNKWDRAVKEYKILEEKYPTTQLGMQIPLYIGKYYNSKGMYSEEGDTYRDAVAFYTGMEKKYSGKAIGYTASILLIQTYLNLKDYESAGRVTEDILRKYASPGAFIQLLPLVQKIYIENLNNPKKAIELYKFVLTKTKDRRLEKILKQKIKLLESNK